MKPYKLIPVLLLISNFLFGQKILLSTIEDITWGSVSSYEPNYGFFGQEFEIEKDATLESIAAYIVDHPDYDETKSTVNFAVWSFGERPIAQIFISNPQKITEKHLENWLKYNLEQPLVLKKGRYLIAVGQSGIQGFVAFGNTKAKEGYKSKFWMKSPMKGYFDGTEWMTAQEVVKKMGSKATDQEIEDETLTKYALMLRVVLGN